MQRDSQTGKTLCPARESLGTGVDVAELKRAEEAGRLTEAYLVEAQKLTRTGSWAWDPHAEVSFHCSEELL